MSRVKEGWRDAHRRMLFCDLLKLEHEAAKNCITTKKKLRSWCTHFGGEKREILSVIIIIFNVFFFAISFSRFVCQRRDLDTQSERESDVHDDFR